ncbi:MAG TPA: hypothetical protein VF315_04705, partial [Steroidobacteraceae bacterium]
MTQKTVYRDGAQVQMTMGHNKALERWLRGFSRLAGLAGLLFGIAALVGWVGNIPTLTSLVPGLATMKANTATAFVLLSVALLTLTSESSASTNTVAAVTTLRLLPSLRRVCAGLVVVIAALTLTEY